MDSRFHGGQQVQSLTHYRVAFFFERSADRPLVKELPWRAGTGSQEVTPDFADHSVCDR
jgi:hypothetical protein